jgi:hypothetical protein
MATTYKVVYKNHCTPQEQVSSGGRYYLDSDCGRKLTGSSETSATISSTGTYNASLDVGDSASDALTSSHTFIFIKNTGGGSGDRVIITLDNSNYLILLHVGESFASEISSSAVVKVKCGTDEDSTIEYYVGR